MWFRNLRALHFFVAELMMMLVWAEKVMWGSWVVPRIVRVFARGLEGIIRYEVRVILDSLFLVFGR